MKKLIISIIILLICCSAMVNISYASYEEPIKVATSVDEIFKDADNFISHGQDLQNQNGINEVELQNTTNFLYNLLLGIGIVAAVIVGIILGIKYMIGSVEEKAEYKETLFAYLISCVVIFGAFGIWRIAILVLSSV